MKKPKPALEALQNLSKQLNAFQNTSQHFSLSAANTLLLQRDTWVHILKYKPNPILGGLEPSPLQNCTLLALFLCPTLARRVSTGGRFFCLQ